MQKNMNQFYQGFNRITINNILQILFVLLGFVIPISTVGTNIILAIFIFLWVLEGKFKLKIRIIKEKKWIKPLILLILFYITSFLFVGPQQETVFIFQRLPLLLVLPIFISSELRQKSLRQGVILFFIISFLSAVLSILDFDLIINIKKILYGEKHKFISTFLKYNYHNIMLAFASILALQILVNHKTKKPVYLIILIFICSLSIFLERGRAGQLIFLLFFVLQSIISFKKKPIYSFAILGFVLLLTLGATYQSQHFHKRVELTKQIIETNGVNAQGYTDVRYTFFKRSYKMIKTKPIFGHGAGTWKTLFNKKNSFQNPEIKEHLHPHNNYIYIWFELGVFGLITFLAIFYFQIKELFKKSYPIYRITLPVILLFLMFIDSYLFVFHITILYIYFYTIYSSYSFK